ncbi:MAG: hypothetical protein K0U68_04770 [Gammaproteobacteria bacterium]|nr:hypothetical protein [Gammaproteobacteria bacterium]
METKSNNVKEWLMLLTALGAVISFLWGVWVWYDKSQKERVSAAVESDRIAETRRIEATKPFLEKQLALYTAATQTTAIIATSSNVAEKEAALSLFWKLYWGDLALVENPDVESAMKAFGDALKNGSNQSIFQQLSLRLAKACRRSLDKSWGINVWTNPDGN